MNDIDILEEGIQKMIKDERIHDDYRNIITAISNLIAENKELKEMLKRRIEYTNELEKDLFQNASNYVIPKSVIEKKIEELEDIKIKTQRLYPHTYTAIGGWLEAHYKIKILQEILDERNNTDE